MDAELKAKWLKALRSGEYTQGKGKLYNYEDRAYCCIGVLAAIQGVNFEDDPRFDIEDDLCTSSLPAELTAGLGPYEAGALADMNDGSGRERPAKTFAEIADYIEASL